MMDFTTVDKEFDEKFPHIGELNSTVGTQDPREQLKSFLHSQIEKALEDKAREVEKYVLDLPLKDKHYVSLQGVLDGIRGVKHDYISLLRGKGEA